MRASTFTILIPLVVAMTFPAWAPAVFGIAEGDPFADLQSSIYWSSTTFAIAPDVAWAVNLLEGGLFDLDKEEERCVWLVRGGQ